MKKSVYLRLAGLFGMIFLVGLAGCESYESVDHSDVDNTGQAPSGGGNGGSGVDEISLDGVVWLDEDVSGWPKTSVLNAHISGDILRLDNTMENEWPPSGLDGRGGGAINANAWVFVQIDGTWYAATWEWLKKGVSHHAKRADWLKGPDGHISSPPLNTWYPRSDEVYGFMVSTPARGNVRTINERSNVSLLTWP